MENLITIRTYSSRLEADIAKSKLDAFKIESLIFADDGGGMRPFPMAYSPGVELKVREKDAAQAKEILENN